MIQKMRNLDTGRLSVVMPGSCPFARARRLRTTPSPINNIVASKAMKISFPSGKIATGNHLKRLWLGNRLNRLASRKEHILLPFWIGPNKTLSSHVSPTNPIGLELRVWRYKYSKNLLFGLVKMITRRFSEWWFWDWQNGGQILTYWWFSDFSFWKKGQKFFPTPHGFHLKTFPTPYGCQKGLKLPLTGFFYLWRELIFSLKKLFLTPNWLQIGKNGLNWPSFFYVT